MKKFKLPQDFIIELRLGSGVGEVVLGPYVLTAHLKYLELSHSGTTLLTAARGANVQIIKTSGQLHIKTSELVLQSDGFPYDSTYWPTGVADSSLSTFDIIGELEVTSVEISDIGGLRYAESLSVSAAVGSKVLTPVASFDFYQDFYGEFGVSSNVTPGSEFLMKEGSYCKVLPADLSGDFFLMFDFVPETSGSFVLMSQEGLTITVEETSVTMEIGSEVHTVTYVSKTDGSADRIVFDRQGRGLTVQCNGNVGEFTSTFKCAKSIEADIFVGFKGKVSAVAFLGYSYLRGETLDLDREAVNVISCKETIPEGEDSPFSMREDGDWSLAVDDGDCFNFGFFSDVDTDVTSNISVVDGKLIIGGVTFSDSGVWNYISLHRKGGLLDVYVDKVFSGTVPYTGDITGAEGNYQIFCCNVQEGLNLTAAPLGVIVAPSDQLSILSNLPGNIQLVRYREGFESSSFHAYVDRETPGGPWVLLISYVGAMGRDILMEDVMSDEIATVTYTNDDSLYPVIPSGLNLALSQIMVKNENPQWIRAVGNPVVLNNRPLVGGIIGREGVDAYSEARGNFKLYGPEAGWYSGSSGASASGTKVFGLMTAIGNGGLCGGANVCGTSACLAITSSGNSCHYDYVNLKQVFVRAASAM